MSEETQVVEGGASSDTTSIAPEFSATLPENWKDSLDEEYRGMELPNDLNALAGEVRTARAFGDGSNSIKMPVTDEDFNSFYNRMGRPEESVGYDFGKPEGFEQSGIEWDDNKSNIWKERFHEMGLSNKQANKLNELFNNDVLAHVKSQKEITTKNNEQLVGLMKNEFGENYEGALRGAEQVADEFKVKEILKEGGVYGNPLVQNLLVALAETKLEDNSFGTGSTTQLEGVNSEIDKIMASDAYWNQDHEGHNHAKNQVHELFKKQSMLS